MESAMTGLKKVSGKRNVALLLSGSVSIGVSKVLRELYGCECAVLTTNSGQRLLYTRAEPSLPTAFSPLTVPRFPPLWKTLSDFQSLTVLQGSADCSTRWTAERDFYCTWVETLTTKQPISQKKSFWGFCFSLLSFAVIHICFEISFHCFLI